MIIFHQIVSYNNIIQNADCVFKNPLTSFPKLNKLYKSSARELHSMPCQKLKPTLVVGFNFESAPPTGCARVPAENKVFVGEAHRHAWRIQEYTIRKILKNRQTEIFLIFVIVYQGAKLGLSKQ
jgi:hypothetical protein